MPFDAKTLTFRVFSNIDFIFFIGSQLFICTQPASCLPRCEYHTAWLAATQIFRLSNLILIPLFKLLSIFHVHSWYSYLPLRLWIFDVIECFENFAYFSLSSGTSSFRKRSVSFFSVGLRRTMCAFVSLSCQKNVSSLRTADVSPRSSPLRDVSRGGTSATQRQKFHTDDAKSVRNPDRSANLSTE